VLQHRPRGKCTKSLVEDLGVSYLASIRLSAESRGPSSDDLKCSEGIRIAKCRGTLRGTETGGILLRAIKSIYGICFVEDLRNGIR
jgi:hypothetical protein